MSTEKEYNKSGKSLTEFPEEVFKISTLTALNLSNNQIEHIPFLIQALKELVFLNFSHNTINELPSELGRLLVLEILNVSYNSLSRLPSSITVLRNLSILDISYNNVEALPADLGSLQQLTKLKCNNNKLVALPRSIGLCSNLKYINASHNELTYIPHELGRLHEILKTLDLADNPLEEPPKEIVSQSPDQILMYLKLNSTHGNRRAIVVSPVPSRSKLKQMKVTVLSAQDLILSSAWMTPISPGLYVELLVGINADKFNRYRTSVTKRDVAPVWNASFTFVSNTTVDVVVTVFAKMHLGPDLPVATCKIPMTSAGVEEEMSLPLVSVADNTKCGDLKMKVAIAGSSGTTLQTDTSISSNVSTGTLPSIAAQAASYTLSVQEPAQLQASEPHQSRRYMTTPGLPPGWERRQDNQGRTFYVDHNTRGTSWNPPPNTEPSAETAEEEAGPLPEGWEERRDPRGRIYYIDHNSRSTTWHRPTVGHVHRVEEFQGRDIQAAAENHEMRSLFGGSTREIPEAETIDPEKMPLPPFWEERITPSGSRYFMNHLLQRTQWTDPRSVSAQLPLPRGWTQSVTAEGRVFFIDHNNRSTQFQDPRLDPEYIQQQEKANAAVPKYVRNFRYKMFLLKQTLQQLQQQGEFKLICGRDSVFQDSYEQIISASPLTLRRRLMVTFTGEEGLDYGGVSREWFFLLSNQMLNPNYCLFEYATSNHNTLKINPDSGINPEHLTYFRFVGRVVGLAVFQQKFIDCGFTLPFYKKLLGRPLVLEDVETIDPNMYKSLKWVIDNDIDELYLGMVFAHDYEKFGEILSIELKPGGNEIDVTDANKAEYIDLMVNFVINHGVEEQMKAFMNGFNEIVTLDKLQMFDERELEVMICGVSEIDTDDWEKNTILRSYTTSNKQIRWLWQCLRSWDNDMRVRFLQFVTGSCRVPIGGFKDLQGSNGPQLFCIEKVGDQTWLPRSHTCFNRLDLPPYKSYEQLVQKITLAVDETEGFAQE